MSHINEINYLRLQFHYVKIIKMKDKSVFYIKIAETTIRIEHRYPLVWFVCHDYITEESPSFLTVSVTEDEIEEALWTYDKIQTVGQAENLLVFLKILQSAYRFRAIPLHAAVIEYEGKGYAFAASSGTGKSTHIRIWKEVFGDAVHVINGDKPLLKALTDENGQMRIRAYGTPWCGKEGLQENASVPLAGLCFLERGIENAIRPCSEEEAVAQFFERIPVPACAEEADFYLQFADRLVSYLPTYLLQCNQNPDAALTAYRGMTQP